jgi:DNA-binding NtrC family response regulator
MIPEVEEILISYGYPGNVRELENIIERLTILSKESIIRIKHLPEFLFRENGRIPGFNRDLKFCEAKQKVIENFEEKYVSDCLRNSRGIICHAAKLAGLHVTNFYSKMKKYGIQAANYKISEKRP